MKKPYILLSAMAIVFAVSCATYEENYRDRAKSSEQNSSRKELDKRFYLIGDAGNATSEENSEALTAFKKLTSSLDTRNEYTLFLGDNIYPAGFSSKNSEESKKRLDSQIEAVKNFQGKTMFIPGNHDWYGDGIAGLKQEQKYIEEALNDNDAFQPKKGCPIEKIDISENIVLLVVDSQWYLADWDKIPTINDNCEIKSRKDFFIELEGELKKNNEKTILLAMHHPALTNGTHGGYHSFDKHIFPFESKIPLPILGSIAVQVRTQGGVSPQDRYNVRYNDLMRRLMTLARGNDRLIFVSGHDHSLQYIEDQGVKQIVSGSGSKNSAAALGNNGLFTYGKRGFAILNVFKDGSSSVDFFGAENGDPKLLFSTEVYKADKDYDISKLPAQFETQKSVTVYNKEATNKGKSYKWFWGDHYRYVYGIDINTPVATLDTLYGGFEIERKGGGHQTRSLRLIDKKGRNFALRGVKKSAVQYLQSVVFTNEFLDEQFDDTVTEDILLDFYSASHPFAGFVVSKLSDAVGVYHTNPKLLYIPKHKALGKYNEEFGDELYVIEERPDDGFLDVESFGTPDAIESSGDVLKKLRKDEKYQIDKESYVRARLFDMLLGDWDRHQDQWRWSRFDISEDKRIYRPIPRDRDQAFSNYDGALLDFLKFVDSPTEMLQEYDGELKDIEWINVAGIKMDRNFTQDVTKDVWLKQANYISEHLTDAIIDDAFEELPDEVKDETMDGIKANLKLRRGKLEDIASRYYYHLTKLVIMTGTDKDDHFQITRGNGTTKIDVSRIRDGQIGAPYRERIINSKETREVWIYGLDDDDQFNVTGTGSDPVFIRIIGGQNNDVYNIENGKNIKVYDHKTKPNTVVSKGGATFRFKDIYSNNIYNFEKYNKHVNTFIPTIGSNPDDGLKIGLVSSFVKKGFKDDPFQQKHIVGAHYYFGTQGFDIKYDGEFANTFGTWSLVLGGHFASENYTQNFFGFGNDTENLEDSKDIDYNRVKTGGIRGKLGVARYGIYGSKIEITGKVEQIKVDQTPGRFVTEFFENSPETFDSKVFGNADITYSYEGYDNPLFPTRGMFFNLSSGVTTNFENTDRTYGYVKPAVTFYNALTRNKRLVLKTSAQGHFNIGDSYEFYQAAELGATTGLRGYREQRFSGQSALAFAADLRMRLFKFKTGLLPLELGVFGGYDYGRVWTADENSSTWHDSVGGGLLLSAVNMVSGQFGVFNSDDGMRISFGFGMSL